MSEENVVPLLQPDPKLFEMTDGYRPIAAYGLIGNTHSAALVGPDGAIDWCCLPHFDSAAVFCRLLDAERGGFFRIGPVGAYAMSRRYLDGTAVLETEFATGSGVARIIDLMHSQSMTRSRLGIDDPRCHRIVRRLDGVELELVLRPTFDFARCPALLSLTPDGARASTAGEQLALRLAPAFPLEIVGDRVVGRVAIEAGDRVWIVLSHASADAGSDALAADAPEALVDETLRHWREWDALCDYRGPFEARVRLSARVLKLLTFGPTGALIAAPTTSLPEEIGGLRNWDYRFCWLRDASLVLHALMSIGYHAAARDFFRWLGNLCEEKCEGLQIMYRLDGSRDLPEQELGHLSGYRGSAPVRVGNAAASQLQLDIFGHVLDAAWRCFEGMQEPIGPGLARVLRHLADQASDRWREPDRGLWEVRGEPRHFVSSKLMCWVALDRAERLFECGKLGGDVERWRQEKEAVRRAILECGYDADEGAFTQAFGDKRLDASALLMPLMGFLPATDPRMHSTVERVRERLTAHGLVYRYVDDDGLPGGEGTFAMASFWLVDNLARQGRIADATALFERIVEFANDLGLLAEEIDPVRRELLGNYPQGFTHLALIEAALSLAAAERGGMDAGRE